MNRQQIINKLKARNIKFDESMSDRQLMALLNESARITKTVNYAGGKIDVVFNEEDTEEPADVLIYDDIGRDPWTGEGITAKDIKATIDGITPKDRTLRFRTNSRGGVVNEGVAIRNILKGWKGKIINIIDGIAASTASWCIPADEVQAYKSSQMFIHQSWGGMYVEGNADDIEKASREAIQFLKTTDDQIADIYSDLTGKSAEEMMALMKAQTLLTGQQAKDLGLVNTLIDGDAVRNFSESELNAMRQKLAALNSLRNSAPKAGEPTKNNQDKIMDKKAMIALLNKWGVKIPENATEDQLLKLVEAGPIENKKPETDPELVKLQNQVKNLEELNNKEKESRIKNAVDKAVQDDKIPAAQKDEWVTNALKDDSILELLNKLPSRPPGAEPLSASNEVEITSDSPKDIEKGVLNLRAPINSMLKGNDLGEKGSSIISANAMRMAGIVAANMKKLLPALNANTIGADLKRIVLLQTALRDFRRRVIALRMFSTVFTNIPLNREGGTAEVAVPFYALDTTASKDYVEATGYEFDQGTVTSSRKVTINKRKYKPFNFYSQELARQPYFNTQVLLALKMEQLGVDVFTDVLSVVTVANYGASVKVEIADGFDSDDVIDIGGACDLVDWPEVGRSLILDTAYHTNLKKDPSLKRMDLSGSDQTLREGSTGRVDRFDIYHSPRLPDNAEYLKGMAVFPSAILVAAAPIQPGPGVRQQLVSYELVIDPETGMAFEYRFWGNPDKDEEREVVEFNYGYAKGQDAALKRLTSQ